MGGWVGVSVTCGEVGQQGLAYGQQRPVLSLEDGGGGLQQRGAGRDLMVGEKQRKRRGRR